MISSYHSIVAAAEAGDYTANKATEQNIKYNYYKGSLEFL